MANKIYTERICGACGGLGDALRSTAGGSSCAACRGTGRLAGEYDYEGHELKMGDVQIPVVTDDALPPGVWYLSAPQTSVEKSLSDLFDELRVEIEALKGRVGALERR